MHVSAAQATVATPRETVASLEAFVRQYYAVLNSAITTGDVKSLDQSMTRGCPCRRVAQFIVTAHKEGRLKGFHYTIGAFEDPAISGSAGSLLVPYFVPAAQLISPDGQVLQSEAPIEGTSAISLIWTGARWLIANVVRIS